MLLGIDVGGTFTDFVLVDPQTASFRTFKRPTSLEDQSLAIADGIMELGIDATALTHVVHGTTAATNAVIERNGARAALVATAGFADVLEFGRRERPSAYGLGAEFRPLIPRADRFELTERVDAEGNVVRGIDAADLAELGRQLAHGGYDAVGVCLLHSYVNPAHEVAVCEFLRRELPAVFVVGSAELYAEQGEFERSSTAAISAFVGPLMSTYLANLATRLRELGTRHGYLVVRSNGSCGQYEAVVANPATTLKSGPAAGVAGALQIAADAGIVDVVTLDMGGTSADISVGVGGRVGTRLDNSIGFRLPIQVPMLDITAIGAGGGSIAEIDPGGVLTVGPRSAGATPGPVCYGKGGTHPTVSDANVALGYLPPFAVEKSGLKPLDRDAARGAIERTIAEPLGIEVARAAHAIREIVNETMAGQIRLHTIDHGRDPASFWLVPFGGGGGLHACAMLRKLGMRGALLPVAPGLTSAFGCITLDARHDCTTSVRKLLDDVDQGDVRRILQRHRAEGEQVLRGQGFASSGLRHEAAFSIRFDGQFHTLDVVTDDFRDLSAERLSREFTTRYGARYGTTIRGRLVVVAIRSTISAAIRPATGLPAMTADSLEPVFAGTRSVDAWVNGQQIAIAVHDRSALPTGTELRGPCVVVQPDSTTWVEPGFACTVAPSGVMLLTRAHTPEQAR